MENTQNIKDLIQKFYPHAKEKLGFDHPVRVIMRQDAENAQQSLGKTAYYDPAEKLIVLYITDRHPKDVLRSFSHELVHHAQNCRGELDDLTTDGHYAKDGKGREIEEEAYLQGNLNLRDYEDNIKFEGVNKMKLTKNQLMGLIERTIEAIVTEKKFPDLTGDGKVTQADILKGRGVKLKEEDDTEREKNKKRTQAAARAAKRTKEKRAQRPRRKGEPQSLPQKMYSITKGEPRELEEQEMVVKANVTVPPEGQRILDLFDSFLAQADAEDAATQAIVSAMLQKAKDKGVDIANPDNAVDLEEVDVDEMHCGGKRDDELEEQEVITPRSAKEKKEEEEKKKDFKKKNPEFSKALDSVRLKDKETAKPSVNVDENNDTWYNSGLYESLKSKWTK